MEKITIYFEISINLTLKNKKGKTDHELREEYYRLEFRTQTGGKRPPAFTPNRSAFCESFIWRVQVNATFGINIPLYRKLNGRLDSVQDPHRVHCRSHSAKQSNKMLYASKKNK